VRIRLVLGVLAATGSTLVAGATPAMSAAPATRSVVGAHVSVAAVGGDLRAGTRVSVIQTCPRGSDLDRVSTRRLGEVHDARLRVASRESWPAGIVTRYRVAKRLSADRPAVVVTAVVCTSRVAASATTATGRAKVDLRVWGPAPARVLLADAVVVAVSDSLAASYVFRTSLAAGGVDAHPASMRNTVRAVQTVLSDADGDAVVAIGETERRILRGRFASMRNNYRYVAKLDEKITVE
jgi:hypothetical protein